MKMTLEEARRQLKEYDDILGILSALSTTIHKDPFLVIGNIDPLSDINDRIYYYHQEYRHKYFRLLADIREVERGVVVISE